MFATIQTLDTETALTDLQLAPSVYWDGFSNPLASFLASGLE